jgi:hypothetical protein
MAFGLAESRKTRQTRIVIPKTRARKPLLNNSLWLHQNHQVSRISEKDGSALYQRENVNLCLWWCINSFDCAMMVSIADYAASFYIRCSNSARGRPDRIATQGSSAVAEGLDVSSELTVTIRMNSMNTGQWTLICASCSVSVWDFFVDHDELWSLCSPAPVSRNQETGQIKHSRLSALYSLGCPKLGSPVQIGNQKIPLSTEFHSGALKAEMEGILRHQTTGIVFHLPVVSSFLDIWPIGQSEIKWTFNQESPKQRVVQWEGMLH